MTSRHNSTNTKMVRIAICVFLAVLSTAYSDKEKTVGDVNVHVSGKSGKIAICFKDQPKEDCLTFRFEDLGERDSNGNPVGQAGSVKHNFNNFAQLDFQLSDVVQDKFQDISVYTFKMTANITSVKATFMSQVYIFAESGSYVWGDEETEVKKGSVKFNIRVEGWKFCGEPGFTCNDGVGSYLDSKICIASKKGSGRKMERKKNKAGERPKGPKGKAKAEKLFFDGDSIVMPRGVDIDGTSKNMPDDYPLLDSNNCFTARFPKFTNYALYDPSATLNDSEAPNGMQMFDTRSSITRLHISLSTMLLLKQWYLLVVAKPSKRFPRPELSSNDEHERVESPCCMRFARYRKEVARPVRLHRRVKFHMTQLVGGWVEKRAFSAIAASTAAEIANIMSDDNDMFRECLFYERA
ncbi:predicted protein [Nematostella vectensis]|uniref:Uncharacterized protein n=1 Tax=Nematostella vectensis TaxID=45351 RepID=A7SQ27_NEMVE|nr:predicted protein [Nematostella vectensis]|eukprot:XP_001626277.1 predicted protein [Nematostella vectensis]